MKKKCLQILFNRPMQYEDGVIYEVRVSYDKDKAKRQWIMLLS